MIKHIKTSKENKILVTELTRKLNLGPENHIARIALAYSLAKDEKLTLADIKDSGGKEYSSRVLFGDNLPYYVSLICSHYGIYKTDTDIPKYIKLHIDSGLELIGAELESNPNLSGFDFIAEMIREGLDNI